jgi:excisionase family DNA binding protein
VKKIRQVDQTLKNLPSNGPCSKKGWRCRNFSVKPRCFQIAGSEKTSVFQGADYKLEKGQKIRYHDITRLNSRKPIKTVKVKQSVETKQSFSTSEVAKFCHVTADTIRKWAEAGRIHVFKTPGGHRRIRREDLLRFLRENGIPIHEELDNSGVKILVVDDEKAVLSVIRRFLERSQTPFQIQVATDGFDAGQQVATFRPDVIFLDLRLPGIDGFEVCRRIKTNPETSNTHVIAMTGYYEGDVAQRVIELGAKMLMQKPFTPDDLRRALAKVGVEVN